MRFTNQWYEMPVSVVVYTNFELYTDGKNIHISIMLSYIVVLRIPCNDIQLWIFHAPHENEDDLLDFMYYLVSLMENVNTFLFDGLSPITCL